MKVVKAILLLMNILLLSAGIYIVAAQAGDGPYVTVLLVIIILFCLLNAGWYAYFRRRFINFSNEVCRNTERIMRHEKTLSTPNKETLTSKLATELEKVEDVFQSRLEESEMEKGELQKTISEISHQLKTPLANIRMYHDMIADPETERDEAEKFMEVIRQQLKKLEFLIDTLVKSSRLERDMITLKVADNRIFRTLEIAVNGIIRKAERKKQDITIDCSSTLKVAHDQRWTAEAIENILDNAVKYTPDHGRISIDVIPGEMYVEIKIKDNGKGIEADHYNDIFKRFYRENSAADEEGLGLGLHIARNIITLQNGYILVRSRVGQGSGFSVFLPKR